MTPVEWAPEAEPQSRKAIRRSSGCPEIVTAVEQRGITGIVHFTRIRGLLGILGSSAVKSRRRLPEDDLVRHVYEPNAADRSRDWPWHDYVNLSVSTINLDMFDYSKGWHPDDDWVILVFDPQILGDPGVVFCTTNNAYPTAHRASGRLGFEQLFASRVPWGYYGSVWQRNSHAPNRTTDPQAEVLYPFELSLEHLITVKVPDDGYAYDEVVAATANFPDDPMVEADPEAFR